MAYPTLVTEIMFARGPYDGTAGATTLTDISAKVKTITTTSGRTSELEATPPGGATITLDNADRAYDPFNTAGAQYGNLLPGRQVRIKATWSGTTYAVWQGFTGEWPQSYTPPEGADVVLPCNDVLGLLAKTTLPDSVYASTVLDDSPLVWYRLNETAGSTMHDSSGNSKHGHYFGDATSLSRPGLVPVDPDLGIAFDGGDSFANAPIYYLGDRPKRALEFWWRGDVRTGASEFRLVSLGHGTRNDDMNIRWDATYGLCVKYPNQASDFAYGMSAVNARKTHHVVVYFNGTAAAHLYIDGVERTLSAIAHVAKSISAYGLRISDNIPGLSEDAKVRLVLDDVALYDVADTTATAALAAAHNTAGRAPWLSDNPRERIANLLGIVSLSSLVPTSTTMSTTHHLSRFGPASFTGASDPVDYLQRIETSEQGRLITRMSTSTGPALDLLERDPAEGSATLAATFSDASSDPYHYGADVVFDTGIDKVRNVVTVHYPGDDDIAGGTVTKRNAASIVTYGERALEVNSLAADADEAAHLAEYLLVLRATARQRVTQLTIEPSSDNRLWPLALGLKIGDRVDVIRHPQNVGAAFTIHCLIDGIDHEIDDGVNLWRTTYRMASLIPTSTVFMQWGSWAWGDGDLWYL